MGWIFSAIWKNMESVCRKSWKRSYLLYYGWWLEKNHKFYDFTFETERILKKLGMTPFDKVVLSYKKISPIKLMLPQAKRLGYTVKLHQNLLVYKK